MIFNGSLSFFASALPVWLPIIIGVAALVIGAVAGILIYGIITGKKIGSAEKTAKKVIEEAYAKASAARKESLLESKEEIHRERVEFDREVKDRRNELQRSEQRNAQKEELLEKKEDALDKKLEAAEQSKKDLAEREHKIAEKQAKVDAAHDNIIAELEKVAQMTRDEAKKILIDNLEEEAKRDAVKTVREIEAQAKEEADKKAQNIVSMAVQRCAVDHSAEITVSVVNLPNDDMKGRIIGREGRNIPTAQRTVSLARAAASVSSASPVLPRRTPS